MFAGRWGATPPQRAIGWMASMCVAALLVLTSGSPSHAYTFPTSCTAAGWTAGYPVSNAGGDTIYVYIEEDFAAELKHCTPANDNDLTEHLLRSEVIAAMEAWNAETRGPGFVYAGTFNAAESEVDGSGVCGSSFLEPSVFVLFNKGCRQLNNACNPLVFANTRDANCASGTNSRILLSVYGDPNGFVFPPGTPPNPYFCEENQGLNWNLSWNNAGGGFPFRAGLLHELGHALNLGHLQANPAPDDTVNGTVMTTGGSSLNGRHPFAFDKECVPWEADARSTWAKWLVYADSSSSYDSGSWGTSYISGSGAKGMVSGGHIRANSGSVYYGRYDDDSKVLYNAAGTGSTFSFSYSSTLGAAAQDLDVDPVLYAPRELPSFGSYTQNYLNFNRTGESYYPPRLDQLRSDDFYAANSLVAWRTCNRNVANPCATTTNSLASHVPMTTAWDAASGNTLFVRVNTTKGDADYGQISIHPGLYNGGPYTLRSATALPYTANVPTESYTNPGFVYEKRTDTHVAVTCAPDRNEWDYNCLLAWQDIGIPNGRVLYDYFNVTCAGELCGVNFRGSITARGTEGATATSTVAGLSAAWFDGRFWLTWKSYDGTPQVFYNNGGFGGSYGAWYQSSLSLPSMAISPPTFLYVPDQTKQSILTWAQ